jgi:hypothetical protein
VKPQTGENVGTVNALSVTLNGLLVLEIEPEEQAFLNTHDQVFPHAGSPVVCLLLVQIDGDRTMTDLRQ